MRGIHAGIEGEYRRLQDAALSLVAADAHPALGPATGVTTDFGSPPYRDVLDLAAARMSQVLAGGAAAIDRGQVPADLVDVLLLTVSALVFERRAAAVLLARAERAAGPGE